MVSKTVIFVHLHKTGGSTFNNVIQRQFNPKKSLAFYGYTNNVYRKESPLQFLEDLKKLDENRKRNIDLLRGHIGFGIHTELPQECDYITLLREPVSRLISHFYYIQESARSNSKSGEELFNTQQLYKSEQLITMSLEDYIDAVREEGVDNRQTRALAGNRGVAYRNSQITDEILEMAKNNLGKYFPVVGTLDNFDGFLLLCKKYYGWNNIFYQVYNKNVKKPKREEISVNTIEQIRELEKFDIKLYEYSKSLMQDQIEKYGSEFDKDLQNFKLANQSFYGQMLALSSTLIKKVQKRLP